MARQRFRVLSVLLVSAAAGFCTWSAIPSSPVDRTLVEVVARSSANPPFVISGKGSFADPWSLQVISPYTKADGKNAPLVVSLGDDPDGIFQSSPPSPIDFAVILKNMHRLGASQAGIPAILSWEKPDVIALSALDSAIADFHQVVTAAPLSRAASGAALPASFRRASLPLKQLHGDTAVLPAVNRISLPDVILGGDSALSGFSVLEQEQSDNLAPLIARWDERAVFAFPLISVLAQRGLSVNDLEIDLGNFIKIGADGPVIPIDEFGRMAVRISPGASSNVIAADSVIDRKENFAGAPDTFALLRDDQSASETLTRNFSRTVAPLIGAITSGAGMTAPQKFQRLSQPLEAGILAGMVILLTCFTPLDRFARQLGYGMVAAVLLIAHFILAGTAAVWLPTLAALAATFAAFLVSRFLKDSLPHATPSATSGCETNLIVGPQFASESDTPALQPSVPAPNGKQACPSRKPAAKQTKIEKPAPKKSATKKAPAAKKAPAKKAAAKKSARTRKNPPADSK